MIMPAVVLVFMFNYIPLSGLVLAFKDFRYEKGIWGSSWNGVENFRFLFASGKGWQLTRNTIGINLLDLITSQGIAIIVAIVLSEMRFRHFKKITQSIIFLPYFIAWTIVGAFIQNIFNVEYGTLNTFLKSIGQEPVNMYQNPGAWIWIICFFNSWKWVGYNSVIYIAAISGLDSECFEAAEIDGANVWQEIHHITFPGIKSTIVIILLLQVGRILRGDFQMFYQIIGKNGQLYDTTDVIDTYVFRSLMNGTDFGMTAAATFYQSVMCCIIITIVNAVVRKIEPDDALF